VGKVTFTYTRQITLSGTLFGDEGSTAFGVAKTIGIAIGTSTVSVHATTSTASGAWSFTFPNTLFATATPIVIWVDGDATTRATLFTKASSTLYSIPNLNLYQNRVIISHEGTSGTSTTLIDLGFYDNDNDPDIQYNASGTASTMVVQTNQKLYLWAGKTLSASGTVEVRGNAMTASTTDGSLHLATSSIFITTGTTTLGGSFTASTSASFTHATSALLFNATTTGKYINHNALATLGTTTFNGSGGAWAFGTTSTSSNFTIVTGTVTAPSTVLNITKDYTNTGGTFTHNSGTTTFAGTAAQTISGIATGTSAFNNVSFLGAGTKTFSSNASTSNFLVNTGSATVTTPTILSISGHYTNNGTTTWGGQSIFNGTSAQTLSGNLASSSAFTSTTTFMGAGAKTFLNNATTTHFVIDSTSGAVTAPPYLSIRGNYTNSGTFTAGSGTTTFSGTTVQTATGTLSGSSAFNNLEVLNSSATTTFGATLTVAGHFKATTPLSIVHFARGATTTLNTASITGTAGNTIKLRSTTDGTQWNFDINGAYTVDYVDVKDSNACPTANPIVNTNFTDSGNNTCWTAVLSGLLLSGTLYSDEGVTPITSLVAIGIAIGTTTTSIHATTSLASGAWSYTVPAGQTVSASTPILIWTDATSSIRASLFTKASSTESITGLNLYQNHVIIRNEASSAVSTTTRASDMSFYDSEDDADIQYTASSTLGRLTLASGQSLFVYATSTFLMDMPITVADDFVVATSSTAIASSTLTVGGDYYNAGTYRGAASSSVWTSRTTSASWSWHSIAYGSNVFAVVGWGGIMTSPNGITWTNRTDPEGNKWYGVTYGNGQFVAVGKLYGGSTDAVITSPDGITWTPHTAPSDNEWQSVTYGNGLYVAVCDYDINFDPCNTVMTSPDGITWTSRAAASAQAWSSVTYGNGLFVAVSYFATTSANAVMTSPDGITWTPRTASEANNWLSVTYGNGLFVAVAGDGTNRVMTSPDGITWTARTAAEANRWLSVTYGNGLYVAVANTGT
jgi:hypothetical protein